MHGQVDNTEDRSDVQVAVQPQSGNGECSCGCRSPQLDSSPQTFVYALGRVQPRFPSLGIEKELAQVIGRGETANLTDRQALHSVISLPENRYLARSLCWALTIEGLDTYLLQPKDPADLDALVGTLRLTPRSTDVDLVIGIRGGIAPPQMCNGLQVPVVSFSKIFSFDVDELIKALPRTEGVPDTEFANAAEDLLNRLLQLADNAGATDEHRALNYLAVRYHQVYALAAERLSKNFSLKAVEVRPSRLAGVRRIVDVIFVFSERTTDVPEKFFVRVDVTEEYPFLVSKLAPFYDRS